ncbi:thioredoxin family protein [Sphingobacterium bovistauri]|uniref:Thioredoxin-like fold domain-containing protein n=1 Tax=Sphingobacterium bovistauri TaxID=2781959 RepID=A0ABS7Z125_9SPHI|nr:thioredoxin family protein [Sphingobacterium bovistauri]MCA5003878.1 hypothetical protein [Sphingobacterium bovistauri]
MKRIVRFLLITIGICAWQNSHAQIIPDSIEHIDSLMLKSPRPILFLLTTDWCKYCALQKKQIRKNQKFKDLSDKLYFIEFDAERKDKITYQGKEYSFKPSGLNVGTHELASALNKSSQISYPSWILVDKEFNPIFKQNSLLKPDQINDLLDAIAYSL